MVQNLNHIRFDRMQRREEGANNLLVAELDRLDQYLGDRWSMTPEFKEQYLRGAGELELVRSGLDDTMRIAYQQMSQRWHRRDRVKDLRTAAFMLAIDKIAAGYRAKGIKQKRRVSGSAFSFFKPLSATIAAAVHWLEPTPMCLAIGLPVCVGKPQNQKSGVAGSPTGHLQVRSVSSRRVSRFSRFH